MKRKALLFALVIAGMAVQAQNVEWGVKGGLTYNMTELGLGSAVSTSGEIFSGERNSNGWHFGLTARDEITSNFYVQADGLYNHSSIQLVGADEHGNAVVQDFDLNSVQFNLAPGFKIFRFLRAQAGLNGDLWLDDDYASAFNRFQLGYQLGVGADLGPITFDIGYNASFKDHEGEWNGIPLRSNKGEILMSVGLLF